MRNKVSALIKMKNQEGFHFYIPFENRTKEYYFKNKEDGVRIRTQFCMIEAVYGLFKKPGNKEHFIELLMDWIIPLSELKGEDPITVFNKLYRIYLAFLPNSLGEYNALLLQHHAGKMNMETDSFYALVYTGGAIISMVQKFQEQDNLELCALIRVMYEAGIKLSDAVNILWSNLSETYLVNVKEGKRGNAYCAPDGGLPQISNDTLMILEKLPKENERIFSRSPKIYRKKLQLSKKTYKTFSIHNLRHYYMLRFDYFYLLDDREKILHKGSAAILFKKLSGGGYHLPIKAL